MRFKYINETKREVSIQLTIYEYSCIYITLELIYWIKVKKGKISK